MSEQSSHKRLARVARLLLPTPGNVLFTLIVVIGVLWAQNAGALALLVTPPPINIPYQGRLADRTGNPLGGTFKMTFRLYNAAGAPTHQWSETYQDANQVQVNNGLFNVMLGSLSPIDQSVISTNPELYLGVTINDDAEMQPRVKLGSVPFATQAWTVPDGLITTAKLAPNAVISDRIADGAVNSADLANQSVTMAKLGPDVQLLPQGAVIMWSGATNAVPSGWQICDGSNSTPDLRNRFVVGAGTSYATGAMGGADQVTLSEAQMPAHSHTLTINAGGQHSHGTRMENDNGFEDGNNKGGVDDTDGTGNIRTTDDGSHTHSGTIGTTGGNQPFDNRPPFYALAFICKL